jgi:uncharacterized OB-fold protein
MSISVHRVAVLILSALFSAAQAQTPSTPSSSPAAQSAASPAQQGAYHPGANTIVLAELTDDLDAKKVKVGDPVKATVSQDLLYKGKIIVPHNARVLGHVIQVTRPAKDNPNASVSVVFESIELSGKKLLPFQNPAIIEAVAAPVKKTVVRTTDVQQMPVHMERGKSSGDAALDAISANAKIAGANMPLNTGMISGASRGVIGLPGLALDNTHLRFSVLTWQKGNSKLPFETQLVLRVTGDSK